MSLFLARTPVEVENVGAERVRQCLDGWDGGLQSGL